MSLTSAQRGRCLHARLRNVSTAWTTSERPRPLSPGRGTAARPSHTSTPQVEHLLTAGCGTLAQCVGSGRPRWSCRPGRPAVLTRLLAGKRRRHTQRPPRAAPEAAVQPARVRL